MSALTLEQLLNAYDTPWHQAAEAWRGLADQVDEAAEQLIRGTRDLPDAWPSGEGSRAAHARATMLRAEVSNTYNPARRIHQALADLAYGVRGFRTRAEQIVASARQAGYTVDAGTGTVTGPAVMVVGDSARIAADGARIAADLAEELAGARALDDATANVITVNLPSAEAGFGQSRMRDVSAAELRAQAGRQPREIGEWWASLTPEQQEQAILAHPELAGRLDGLPATDRDTANRIVLDREVTALNQERQDLDARESHLRSMAEQGRIAEVYPDAANPGGRLLDELGRIEDRRESLAGRSAGPLALHQRLRDPSQPPAFLLGYSSADDGRAIVAVNNPDEADNVVTYVPGTMADLAGIKGDVERADKMVLDATRLDPSGRTTSAITWLGYDAPDFFHNAGSSSYAENASADLSRFQNGLRVSHDGDASHNTVLGHSYGTTTVGIAARDKGLAVDDVIFVGSPGVGAGSASELNIQGDASNVWPSTDANDVIRHTGFDDTMRFGENPSGAAFGGRIFTSDSDEWSPVATHSGYWDANNPSRRGIAYIVTGQEGRVS